MSLQEQFRQDNVAYIVSPVDTDVHEEKVQKMEDGSCSSLTSSKGKPTGRARGISGHVARFAERRTERNVQWCKHDNDAISSRMACICSGFRSAYTLLRPLHTNYRCNTVSFFAHNVFSIPLTSGIEKTSHKRGD